MPRNIPTSLADGRVVATLSVDQSMHFTGKLKLFSGDEKIGRVPNLAIVRKGRSRDLLVVHCDENWNVLGVQAWNAPEGERLQTIERAKEIVERYYKNSADKWTTAEDQE